MPKFQFLSFSGLKDSVSRKPRIESVETTTSSETILVFQLIEIWNDAIAFSCDELFVRAVLPVSRQTTACLSWQAGQAG